MLELCFPLISLTLGARYVPVDHSGDGMYQLVDFMSLCTVLQLLYRVRWWSDSSVVIDFSKRFF